MNNKTGSENDGYRTFLVFRSADESFAVSITLVEEILEYTKPVKIPRTPEFLHGIINVRGKLLPVLDLRLRFGMPEAEITADSGIIIIKMDWEDDEVSLGILTDSVEDVIDLPEEAIGKQLEIGISIENSFIQGTAEYNNRILLLIDIDKVLNKDFLNKSFEGLSNRSPDVQKE